MKTERQSFSVDVEDRELSVSILKTMTSNLQIKDLELNVWDINEEHTSLTTYLSRQMRKKRSMSTIFE